MIRVVKKECHTRRFTNQLDEGEILIAQQDNLFRILIRQHANDLKWRWAEVRKYELTFADRNVSSWHNSMRKAAEAKLEQDFELYSFPTLVEALEYIAKKSRND